MNDTWVVGSEVSPSFLGLVNKAASLMRGRASTIKAVLVSPALPEPAAPLLGAAGAELIYTLPLDGGDINSVGPAVEALRALWLQTRPEHIFFETSAFFASVAPAFACAVGCGITADCTELAWDGSGRLMQIRPAFGGRKLASNINVTGSSIATVRKGVFHCQPTPSLAELPIIRLTPPKCAAPWTLIESRVEASAGPELSTAGIILSGGLGMGSRESFRRLYRLAELMGAAVGASRAAVAAGFSLYDHQVGQTGVSVRPELYIAFGISGAVQHLSGITGAKKIIAVNSDPKAPIHAYSELSIIADCNQVVEGLIAHLENRS